MSDKATSEPPLEGLISEFLSLLSLQNFKNINSFTLKPGGRMRYQYTFDIEKWGDEVISQRLLVFALIKSCGYPK